MRLLPMVFTLALACGCSDKDSAPPSPAEEAPAQDQTPQSPPPAPQAAPTTTPAPTPGSGDSAGDASCVSDCVRRNQMRAIAAEEIQRDCESECSAAEKQQP